MIKSFLQLVRIPGTFTAVSNVLVGFFIAREIDLDWSNLGFLLASSCFLYMAGMVFNDYFDYKIDKKESPMRPLPSNKISLKSAKYLGVIFLIIANFLSLFVSIQSFAISIVMTGLILAYDKKLKKYLFIGIPNLAAIRFFNVFLGASAFSLSLMISWVAIPIALFIVGISILAVKERSGYSKKGEIFNIIFVSATIIFVVIITYEKDFSHFIFLAIFSFIVFIPYFLHNSKTQAGIQKKVSFQLLAIIILDATLISAHSDFVYGILTAILFIPAYFIAKKMYVT